MKLKETYRKILKLFCPWDICPFGRFVLGTFCLRTFCLGTFCMCIDFTLLNRIPHYERRP